MKKLKSLLIFTPVMVLSMSLAAVPVLARDGSSTPVGSNQQGSTTGGQQPVSDNSSSNSGGSGSGQPGGQAGSNNPVNEPVSGSGQHSPQFTSETSPSITNKTETDNENEANNIVEQFKKTGHEHSQDERTKNCNASQHGLQTKFVNLATNAGKIQSKIDGIFTKALTYQQTNNITVNNFDTLVANAKAAQAQSAASISALQALNPTIDCSQPNVAQQVAVFKAAAEKARTDLKAYKQSVVAILQALELAKGGTQ